jgi:RNA recognition motif-containing protein
MIKYNLYFKNVPLDSTEEELKEFFSLFGEIKSLKLMRKKVEAADPIAEEEEKSSAPETSP